MIMSRCWEMLSNGVKIRLVYILIISPFELLRVHLRLSASGRTKRYRMECICGVYEGGSGGEVRKFHTLICLSDNGINNNRRSDGQLAFGTRSHVFFFSVCERM